jgi:hypothetical protein
MFFSSQNIDFPFLFAETLGPFFFLLFFNIFMSLSIFFNAPSLWGHGGFDDKRGEKHNLIFFRWNEMEWLSHDYGNGGVVGVSTVDAYSRMELYMPILLGEASKKIWLGNHFQKISKLTMDTSIKKAQHKQELLCG